MPAANPSDRALVARQAAHTRWARCDDPKAATAPARKGFLARFEREVDPDQTLDPAERARRAEHAMRAYMTRMAMRSSQSRRGSGSR
ncbi:hypothetical protein Val02_68870 [Virgisporangium aliadipatigenens]|uniref:Uncharacterized protein n=1 Tax=Virgisporangium aliadipatigenens TaxID=741659 RepID=A0A8J3YUE7_9ACTN|nr:hypothetical protein Val02_68870 [Virgisporangium aliadipatigenens]